MDTVYLNEFGTKVKKNGGKIVVEKLDGSITQLPSKLIKCFVVTANVQISCEAIKEILRNDGRIIYMDSNGSILGTLGSDHNAGRKLVRQLEAYIDPDKRTQIARYIVKKKLLTQRDLLLGFNKRKHNALVKEAANSIYGIYMRSDFVYDVNKLMGMEGIAAKKYFEVWNNLVDDYGLEWKGRKKHPATDPINSMLSFAYSLLEKDIRAVIASKSLSVTIGFLHEVNYRKDSFVYDVMEPFRAMIAEKYVLMCLRWQRFKEDDFEVNAKGCYFKADAKKRFIEGYEMFVAGETEQAKGRVAIKEFVESILAMLSSEEFEELAI